VSDAPSEPRFPFVAVDVPSHRSDDVGARWFELGASGVEVRDDSTLQKGPGGDTVRLVASFDDTSGAERARDVFVAEEPELWCELGEIVGDAWRDKYKEHFKPFSLTPRLVVAPPWEQYAPKPDELVLVMDPGRAFGTGLHATTSMVAGLLEKYQPRLAAARVLDVGTGSGILGLVTLALGAETVVAIDNDPDVIEIAAENAERNGFEASMQVSAIALSHVDGAFDVVVANIRSEVLITMVADIAARARPDALVVLSGILASERDDVIRAYVADFDQLETAIHQEATDAWVAIALSRRAST
jgi:ribosomal protein L11 methyltransferase